ncbi:YggS family pyridoxal phosphate-dependent enzyme [Streptococcus hongkongensis]
MDLQKNRDQVLEDVRTASIKAHRNPEDVHVIAVTKYVDSEVASALMDTGLSHIAENRVDKFLDKYEALKEKKLTWHLIGSLQRRKVKSVINLVDYFHALDSVSLAEEIQKRADHPIKCFLQVNISGEESKHGFSISEIPQIIENISQLDKVQLVGLMTMAPLGASEETIREIFHQANQLRKTLKSENRKNMPFTELSIGMSGDYRIAIQEGATFIRIGSSFFK